MTHTQPASQAGGDVVPQHNVPVTLDAVASHLRRRAASAEQEALMLAITVRDLAEHNERLKRRIAELESANG